MIRFCIARLWFVLVASLFASPGMAQSDVAGPSLEQLKRGERALVVGHLADFPPFHYVGKNGKASGMDREIVLAMTKRLGIQKVEFRDVRFGGLKKALSDGSIDMIANNFWTTPEREEQFALTTPYYVKGGIGALWLKGKGPFKDLASLAGHRVSVIKGTYTESVVKEQVPTATVIPVDEEETLLEKKLKDGEADVHLAYYTRLLFVMKSKDDANTFEDALIKPMKSTFALRRSETELRDAINQTLAAMWKDGSLKKIKKHHLEPLGIEPANHP